MGKIVLEPARMFYHFNYGFVKKLIICLVSFNFLLPAIIKAEEKKFTGFDFISTEHFIIIHEPHDKSDAVEISGFAEKVFDQISQYFDSVPKCKINVLLTGRFDTPNGYYSPFPPHITISLTGTSGAIGWISDTEWLKLVFVHEVVHYIQMNHEDSLATKLSCVFGPSFSALNVLGIPPWALEGITTNLETAFTNGGRGRSKFFEMYWKAAIVEQEFWRLEEASSSGPEVVPAGRWYVAGYLFIAYLRSRFGNHVFSEIEKIRYTEFLNFEEAIRKTTGKSIDVLYDDMRMELSRIYDKDLSIPDGFRISPRKTAFNYFPPASSQNGKLILFRTRPDFRDAVVIYDPETEKEQILFETSIWPFGMSASADGSRISYATGQVDFINPVTYRSDVWIWNSETGKSTRITHDGGYTQTALSPDGKRLIAVRIQGSSSRLEELREDGSVISTLFPLTERDGKDSVKWNVSEPAFSSDGKKVTFVAGTESGMQLAILELDSGEIKRYVTPYLHTNSIFDADIKSETIINASIFMPRFDSDGSILFGCDKNGNIAVYRWNPAEKSVVMEIEDPVGAYCGIPTTNGLVYGSLSYKGFVLKRPSEIRPTGNLELFQIETGKYDPYENEIISPVPEYQTKHFLNFPKPELFLPFPAFIISSPEFRFGIGAFTLFSSLPAGNGSELAFAAAWYPQINQVGAFGFMQSSLGPLGLMAGAIRDPKYLNNGYFSVDQTAIFSIGFPVIDWMRSPYALELKTRTGFVYTSVDQALNEFGLEGPPIEGVANSLSWLFTSISARYARAGIPVSGILANQINFEAIAAFIPDPENAIAGFSIKGIGSGRIVLGQLGFQADCEAAYRFFGSSVFYPGPTGFRENPLTAINIPDFSIAGGISILAPFGGLILENRMEAMAGYSTKWILSPFLYYNAGFFIESGSINIRSGFAFKFIPGVEGENPSENFLFYFSINGIPGL